MTWLRRPSRSDWALIGIFWTAALPFILLDFRVTVAKIGWLRFVVGTVWSVLIPNVMALLLVYGLMPALLFRRQYAAFLAALVGLSFLTAALYWRGKGMVWQFEPVMSIANIAYTIPELIRSVGILAAVLTGKHFIEMQQQLLTSEKERAEAELRQLKAQIDPHFLFNNLNVLGVLIQRNPSEASDYLHRFSALYRYLIRHKDEEVVPLADELTFVNDYAYLMRQRFGRAYELVPAIGVTSQREVLVSPGAVQTLIENAIKHNRGSDTDPLLIEITITAQTIQVRNERRPKRTPVDSTRTGLANLVARYALLTDQPVRVLPDDTHFLVELPLLTVAQPVRSTRPWPADKAL